MKVIDLVQAVLKLKTTNKEVYIPTFIKYKDEVYCFDDRYSNYYANEGQYQLFDWNEDMLDILNHEIEVLEEDKEIEKINSIKVPTISNSREKNIENIEETLNKYWFVINKLTEAVNELKKGK